MKPFGGFFSSFEPPAHKELHLLHAHVHLCQGASLVIHRLLPASQQTQQHLVHASTLTSGGFDWSPVCYTHVMSS